MTVEKQLFRLSLKQGVDERVRSELMDGQSAVTRLENLVQNQTGAWVKSPGFTLLNEGTTDDTGNVLFGQVNKLMRLQSGLGAISEGRFFHYNEAQNNFRAKNYVQDYSVKASVVSTIQNSADWPEVGHTIVCSASNSRYDVVVYEAGPGESFSADRTYIMAIVERDGGNVLAKLCLAWQTNEDHDTPGNFRTVFVNDRYLHLWVQSSSRLYVVQFDSEVAWPASLSQHIIDNGIFEAIASGPGLFSPYNTYDLYDVTTYGDKSFIVEFLGENGDDMSIGGLIASCDTDGNTATELVVDYQPMSCDVDAAGNLWTIGTKVSTTDAWVYVVEQNDLTSVVHSYTQVLTWSGIPGLASDSGGILRVIDCDDSYTFGSGTIPKVTVYSTSSTGDTSLDVDGVFYGWLPASTPFWNSFNEQFYCHFVKYDTSTTVVPHVIANLTVTPVKTKVSSSPDYFFDTIFLAAILEPYSAEGMTVNAGPEPGYNSDLGRFQQVRRRYFLYSNYKINATLALKVSSRSASIISYELATNDPRSNQSQLFGGLSYVSGGFLGMYDGYRFIEQGFADYPLIDVDAAGNTGPTGAYQYMVVFKHSDTSGQTAYSRMYGPFSFTTTTSTDITVQPLAITNKESGLPGDQQTIVEVYRTVSGGTQFYLLASSQVNANIEYLSPVETTLQLLQTNDRSFWEVEDTMDDTDIQTQPLLYRQPGTPNTALDRYPAPSGSFCISQHKDRVFVTDPFGNRVYYSSFFVDGESAWFNPAFSIFVHGGTGPITGLVSMDGRLFVFKKDAIFVIDGDGPSESGGNGTEFTSPQRLATSYGCVEPRSLVLTPDGVMYKSTNGLYILTRSLKVVWIGDKVQDTVDTFNVCTAAVVSADGFRVRFALVLAETYTAIGTGVHVVFDTTENAWSTETYPGGSTCTAMTTFESGGNEYTASASGPDIGFMDISTGLDQGIYKPSVLETGWIKAVGPQGRQRVFEILSLLKKVSGANHAMTLECAYDYSDTYDYSKTWQPDVINDLDIEELVLHPDRQDLRAIRFRLSDSEPTDSTSYPAGTGKGFELLDVTFNMAPKKGSPPLPVAAKA